MRANFGEHFKLTIFGESHGPAIGVVLEDVPSGISMDMDFIAAELRRRATGNSPLSTPRKRPISPGRWRGARRAATRPRRREKRRTRCASSPAR